MNRAVNFLLLMAIFLTMATTAFCDTGEDFFNSGRAKIAKADLQNAPNPTKEWLTNAKAGLDGAIADYTKAIELKPDYADAYYHRGLAKQAKCSFGGFVWTERGELDEAIADYTKAIELKPDYADAYYHRGLAKQASGDVAHATGLLYRPHKGKEAKGDVADAIADYTKAIELKPDYADAYYNRGLAKQAEGDLDGARVDCTKAIELKHKIKVNPKDGLTYVWIEPGTFRMGYYQLEESSLPLGFWLTTIGTPTHQVTITKGFWIGQTVVTQEAYQKVMGANPSHFKEPKLPVEMVNWNESQSYCQALGMRLPTEVEWEYAARAGSTSPVLYGDIAQIKGVGNEPRVIKGSYGKRTEVMQKLPNAWGLYDIFGNVFQWTASYEFQNQQSSETDPQGVATTVPGFPMVVLGGTRWVRGWGGNYRVPARMGFKPEEAGRSLSFRCAGN